MHIATVDSSGTKHVHKDHLGSTRVVTSASGAVISQHRYWPFGEEMTVTSSPERMRFAGHERDLTSYLDYMHARYYAPWGGRFLSVDPGRDFDSAHPQSLNLYSYVRNNPLGAIDPDGRAFFLVGAAPAAYAAGTALMAATAAWLAAPSTAHPGKTNAQVMGEGVASLAQVFAKPWTHPRRLDLGVANSERQRALRAKQKSDRRLGPKQPKGSGPLPPGAPGPNTEIGERPHLQNAPSEVDIWTVLATAEALRQVLVNSIVYQWKTWLSPAEQERKLGQEQQEEARKAAVMVTSETPPTEDRQSSQ